MAPGGSGGPMAPGGSSSPGGPGGPGGLGGPGVPGSQKWVPLFYHAISSVYCL